MAGNDAWNVYMWTFKYLICQQLKLYLFNFHSICMYICMYMCIYILCRKSPGPSLKVRCVGPGPNWANGPMGPTGSRAQLGQWDQMGPRPNWANGHKWFTA